jgi:diguanylate cyclase (GGDEF)-like protein
MMLYALLDRVFPRSFLAKVVLVAMLCGQAPLAALAVGHAMGAVQPGWIWPALCAAIVSGISVAILGLRAVLRPIMQLEAAFAAFEDGAPGTAPLDDRHADPVGRLVARAGRLMRTAETRIDAAQRLADLDPLTHLLNRRGFERALAARRGAGERGALLMLDLDHFKQVNDAFGHDEGDRVLRSLADLLRGQVRRRDLAARFGGEEFVIYLAGLGREPALQVAERLRMGVEDRIRVAGRAKTLSIGVALWPPGTSFADILKRADAAVYAAKADGRNRVRLADAGTDLAVTGGGRRCAAGAQASGNAVGAAARGAA